MVPLRGQGVDLRGTDLDRRELGENEKRVEQDEDEGNEKKECGLQRGLPTTR
jgi:hypothetical protein